MEHNRTSTHQSSSKDLDDPCGVKAVQELLIVCNERRHMDKIQGLDHDSQQQWPEWGEFRYQQRIIQTECVCTVMCLKPDKLSIEKRVSVYSALECWIDTTTPKQGPLTQGTTTEAVSLNLQGQLENLRFKSGTFCLHCCPPTQDLIEEKCKIARACYQEKRVMMLYNGHDVPEPTDNGHFWVFWGKSKDILKAEEEEEAVLPFYLENPSPNGKSEDILKAEEEEEPVRSADPHRGQGFSNPQYKEWRVCHTPIDLFRGFSYPPQESLEGKSEDILEAEEEEEPVLPFCFKNPRPYRRPSIRRERTKDISLEYPSPDVSPEFVKLSVDTIQEWLGRPVVYIFDCHYAARLLEPLLPTEPEGAGKDGNFMTNIILAACDVDKRLPFGHGLPADIFTSCLTTPIRISARWFIIGNPGMYPDLTTEMVDSIPGDIIDPHSMLGDLYRIFSVVTEAIAWSTCSRDTFKLLYGEDIAVASLFRNYLLADRIMRVLDVPPVSFPKLPLTHTHQLWRTWDYILEKSLEQLPRVMKGANYQTSSFFSEQLSFLEQWLMNPTATYVPRYPQQLPIALNILTRPRHQQQVFKLLAKFCDFGPEAVKELLALGLYPRLLIMLSSRSMKLSPSFICLWTKFIAYDSPCQMDLMEKKRYKYFIHALADQTKMATEDRMRAAYILTKFMDDHPAGQLACLKHDLISICLKQMDSGDDNLRLWLALCLGKIWTNHDKASKSGKDNFSYKALYILLDDHAPLVRAAAVFALGTLIYNGSEGLKLQESVELDIASTLTYCASDGSSVVRQELVEAYSGLLQKLDWAFVATSSLHDWICENENGYSGKHQPFSAPVFIKCCSVWKAVLLLAADPHPDVQDRAKLSVDYIKKKASMQHGRRPNILELLAVVIGDNSNTMHVGSFQPVSSVMQKVTAVNESSDAADVKLPSRELPCETKLFKWSCGQFVRSVDWAKKENPNPGYDNYMDQLFIKRRITPVTELVQMQQHAGNEILKKRVLVRDVGSPAKAITFLPYDHYMAVSNTNCVSVWDTQTGQCTNTLHDNNYWASHVSSLAFFNAHRTPLLMCGSDDGCVRIWRDFEKEENELHLATSFVGLSFDNNPVDFNNSGSGKEMVTYWQQDTATLMCCGTAAHVSLWDLQTEQKKQDMMTGSLGPVTHLTGHNHSSMLAAGCADGTVRLFDCRMSASHSCVRAFQQHPGPVLRVKVKGQDSRVISASEAGDVKTIDLRSSQTLHNRKLSGRGFRAVEFHPNADILACCRDLSPLYMYDESGLRLRKTIKLKHACLWFFLRNDFISCLAFHPLLTHLAVGTSRSDVSVFST